MASYLGGYGFNPKPGMLIQPKGLGKGDDLRSFRSAVQWLSGSIRLLGSKGC